MLGVLRPPTNVHGYPTPIPPSTLGDFFGGVGAGLNPEAHELEQRGIAARATYEALLAAGAPETLACAAALNPQVFQTVGTNVFKAVPLTE